MKKLLLILLFLPMIGFGQQTYVPDDDFEEALINLGLDAPPLDDYVYTSMINTVTLLDLSNEGVNDYTGIEDFIALSIFNGNGNPASSIDLSNLTTLTEFTHENSGIVDVNLSGCNSLLELRCESNPNLINLDVSGCTDLTYMDCISTGLSSLNLSGLTSLEELRLAGTSSLSALNVYNCPNLNWIILTNSQVTSLDLSTNTSLLWLDIYHNQLTTLDVSNCSNLQRLLASNNNLNSVTVTGTDLIELELHQNNLTTLDLSGLGKLSTVQAHTNSLTSVNLDGIGFTSTWNGVEIYLYYNNLTYVDASCVGYLDKLSVSNNPLISLNLQNTRNTYIGIVNASSTSLQCVQVDDEAWSFVNWSTSGSFNFGSNYNFSANCGYINCTPNSNEEMINDLESKLLKVTDVLGREAKGTENEVLFYIYDDGTVEKRIVIE
jgi:hypothetical protein